MCGISDDIVTYFQKEVQIYKCLLLLKIEASCRLGSNHGYVQLYIYIPVVSRRIGFKDKPKQ
jgi:hypothetical protein